MKNLIVSVACVMLLIAGCKTNPKTENEKEQTKKWTDRVIPLPHEVDVRGSVNVPIAEIHYKSTLQTPQQIEIAKLLKPFDNTQNPGAVTIKLGLVTDDSRHVPTGILERLKRVPNKDQAYAIISSKQGDKLSVILTANTGYGLLYATRTFMQMLNIPENSTPETLVEVPVVNVLDWPDIGSRGQWSNHAYFFIPELSKLKLNLVVNLARTAIDKNGNPLIQDQSEKIRQAAEYGIKYVLDIPHLSTLGDGPLGKVPYDKKLKHLLPALAKQKNGKPAHYPDFESKEMQELFSRWLMQIADSIAPYHNILNIWLSEGEPGNFTTCKGNRVSYEIELNAIQKAFAEVKKKYPDLILQVALSQGTRRAGKNEEIIDYCDKNNFGVLYYDGHKTYISDKKPMIFPKLTQLAAKGKWVGCIPQLTNSWRTVVPITSPQLIKFRCQEFVDKKLSCIFGYTVPNKLYYEFNLTAMAEWSWNANGRTPEEFSRVYALSKGISNPELFSEWAMKEGKASWELAASNMMICLVHDPAMGFYGGVPFDYTYGGASKLRDIPDLEKMIKTAEEALKLAEKLNEPDLINESEFTYHALKSFQVLKEVSTTVKKKKISLEDKRELEKNLDQLDYSAHRIRNCATEWGKRHAARQYWMKDVVFLPDRLLEVANVLRQTADTLRTVTACLQIPDPRPETRLVDVGEWTIKDITKNKAKLRFDVTHLVSRQGGSYNVCLDLLESKGLRCVIVSWIKLLASTPGEPMKVLTVSKETFGGAYPRIRSSVPHIECGLEVPETKQTQKLILEVDLYMWAMGRVYPESFPEKEQVCWGLVSLRRGYKNGEFPKKESCLKNALITTSNSTEEGRNEFIIHKKGEVIQVGVTNGYHSEGLLKSLKGRTGIHAFPVPRLTPEALSKCDVLLVSQAVNPLYLNRCSKLLVDWVAAGGNMMFFHDAVGYRKHLGVFKDIGQGASHPKCNKVKATKKHPVTDGLKIGDYFSPGYQFDHVVIEVGPQGEILLASQEGRPVLVVGELGKGRIILNGMLTGSEAVPGKARGTLAAAKGEELKILTNAIQWLAN